MKIGYARISTAEQRFDRQIDLLREHGAERIYRDIESGGKRSREELDLLLNQLRNNDLVVVVTLDRELCPKVVRGELEKKAAYLV